MRKSNNVDETMKQSYYDEKTLTSKAVETPLEK